MIQVQDLTVRYPDTVALQGVTLRVSPGTFLLVGGPSGGGKSTLARTLMGLIPRSIPAEVTGSLLVGGMNPQQCSVAHMAAKVGMVFQNPATQLFNGTVEEEVAFGPRNLGVSGQDLETRVTQALQAVEGTPLRSRQVRHLSGGEQQRVAIAAVLAMRPSLLILDEPTANLDGEGIRSIVDTLVRLCRDHGVTIVVMEHRLAPFVPHADRLVWLAGGQVTACGAPAETLARVQPAGPPPSAPPPASGEPLVTAQGIVAGYNGRSVLRDCSLTLRRGEFAALLGPNGAGKTTLARVLAGVHRPRRGRVVWHGVRRRRVGLLQQNPLHQLVCDTVGEEVRFGAENVGAGRPDLVTELMARTGLVPLRHRSTQALSVGQQQRAALAATLSVSPGLLILDEPTVGQDWSHLVRVMDLLAESNRAGQTVLLITHDRRLVERYASGKWVMEGGRIEGGEG